jgi:hypothetical protein
VSLFQLKIERHQVGLGLTNIANVARLDSVAFGDV